MAKITWNPAVATVWSSAITEDMVADVTPEDLAQMIEELNDAVSAICQDFGVWA